MVMAAECLFCKIVKREIPADIVYESDDLLAFRDINPQAPVHVLLIPKRHIATVNDLAEGDAELVARLLLAGPLLAEREGIAKNGFRLVMNCNEAGGQTVFHVHLHLLGGRNLRWPPG
jgi:histidine triad (HIT) family protein